jgi:hypothetical protein
VPADFLNDEREIAGTPARNEREFKLPFIIDSNQSTEDVKRLVRTALENILATGSTHFSSLTGRNYYLDGGYQAFAFKDHYFDTPELQVLQANSSYRLRYRWNRKEAYVRHRIFPFLQAFNPTRCEIQFKAGYVNEASTNIVAVKETRFEFRNESEPFVREKNAPPAPWKEEKFLPLMVSGIYENYRTRPMASLLATVKGAQDKKLDLKKQFELITFRERMHLNMKHPWGSGPNPEQVFIITLDHSMLENTLRPIKKEYQGKQLLEIEIEIERNANTEIDRIIENADNAEAHVKPIVSLAVETSKRANLLLNEDLLVIRRAVIEALKNHPDIAPLPADYKYSRFVKWLVGSVKKN